MCVREVIRDNYQKSGVRQRVIAYTDGCSRPHFEPHNGGWAFIVLEDKESLDVDDILHEGYGYSTETTNNEMECKAILELVRWMPANCDVEVRADSNIAMRIMGRGYAKGNVLMNMAQEFSDMVRMKNLGITFAHVKGHDTDPWNDRCDILTNYARNTADLVYGVDYDTLKRNKSQQ